MHRAVTAVVPLVVTIFVILPELVLPTKVCKTDEMTVRDSQGSFVECFPCQPCLEGLELFPECGSDITKEQKEKNIECRPCKPGFFSDKLDVLPCRECQHCLDAVPVKTGCTNMTDTECGDKCGEGFYHEKTSLDCQKCSCCCGDSKDIEIAKCVKDNKPANHHCTSHRRLECCKKPPVHTGDRSDRKTNLPVGVIIGIVAAVIVVGVALSFLFYRFYYVKRKRQGTREKGAQPDQTTADAQKEKSGPQTSVQSDRHEALKLVLPSYENTCGSVDQLSQEPVMHRDAKQNRLSNTAFVNSEPSTPDLNIKDFRVKISENAAQVTLTQPPQRQEITRQKSTSSDSDKTELQHKRSGSISSIVSGISRKLSIRQGSFDEESLVPKEEVHLPENQVFKLKDLDLCKTETLGKLLDNHPAGNKVNSTKQLATYYKMKKLDIQELANNSKPGEKVLGFINAKYPNVTVYEFCKVLGEKLERNDIVEELHDYLYQIETQPPSHV